MRVFLSLVLAVALATQAFGSTGMKGKFMKSVTSKVLSLAAAAGFTAVMVFSQPADAVEIGVGASYDAHHKDVQAGLTASHNFSGVGIAGSLFLKDVKQVKELDTLANLDSYDWSVHADKSWSLAKELDVGFNIDHVSYAGDFVLSDAHVALKYRPIELLAVQGGGGLLGDDFASLDKVYFLGVDASIAGLSVDAKRYFSLDTRDRIYDAISVSYSITDAVDVSGSYHHYDDTDKRVLIGANFTLADLFDKQ